MSAGDPAEVLLESAEDPAEVLLGQEAEKPKLKKIWVGDGGYYIATGPPLFDVSQKPAVMSFSYDHRRRIRGTFTAKCYKFQFEKELKCLGYVFGGIFVKMNSYSKNPNNRNETINSFEGYARDEKYYRLEKMHKVYYAWEANDKWGSEDRLWYIPLEYGTLSYFTLPGFTNPASIRPMDTTLLEGSSLVKFKKGSLEFVVGGSKPNSYPGEMNPWFIVAESTSSEYYHDFIGKTILKSDLVEAVKLFKGSGVYNIRLSESYDSRDLYGLKTIGSRGTGKNATFYGIADEQGIAFLGILEIPEIDDPHGIRFERVIIAFRKSQYVWNPYYDKAKFPDTVRPLAAAMYSYFTGDDVDQKMFRRFKRKVEKRGIYVDSSATAAKTRNKMARSRIEDY